MEPFLKMICIFFGGATGALTRFGIGKFFQHALRLPSWMAILFANIAGCLIIGFGFAFLPSEIHATTLHNTSPCALVVVEMNVRLLMALLLTGFCGGLTTFSAFGLDTWILYYQRNYAAVAFYVVFSVLLGLIAVAGGIWIGKSFGV